MSATIWGGETRGKIRFYPKKMKISSKGYCFQNVVKPVLAREVIKCIGNNCYRRTINLCTYTEFESTIEIKIRTKPFFKINIGQVPPLGGRACTLLMMM